MKSIFIWVRWKGLKERINSFVRMGNERMPDELAPLGEIK